jgi:hypothetical protein
MTESSGSCHFIYEHTDFPEGMTIAGWRAQRAAERRELQLAARQARRRRRAQAMRRWLGPLRAPIHWPRLGGREVHG